MRIELLVVPDCPHEEAAAELIRAAVADTQVQANVTRTIITGQAQAQDPGFIGSPTILLNGHRPVRCPAGSGGSCLSALHHPQRSTRHSGTIGSAASADASSGRLNRESEPRLVPDPPARRSRQECVTS
jgi:hypothetical protein